MEKFAVKKLLIIVVKKLQDYITNHYYHCTNTILNGLGKIYDVGGEFTDNIDLAGGKGCAHFTARAIEFYCANNE